MAKKLSRRQMLKLVGLGAAGAALAARRRGVAPAVEREQFSLVVATSVAFGRLL
mgnify:CR=1 FL=1